MIADTAREMEKVVKFIGIASGSEQIVQAVERSSAGRMRKLEQAQTDQCDLTKNSRKDLSFVRAAGSGGWKSDLPQPMVEKIEAAWGQLMRHLGYELTSQSPAEARDFESLGILGKTPR
jgi:hypothetical protein